MHFPDWFKLAGILLVVIGFALRLKPTLVVVAAAMLTGVLAGIPLFSNAATHNEGIINMLGRAFTENRLMTLFIITLPAIGLSERFGLQRQSARLIQRFRAATAGRLLIAYQMFRVAMGAMGLRLNGQPTFVRPLVYPMALGAAEAGTEVLADRDLERVKAASAAAENYGNFYGQNLSPVQPGILLVFGALKAQGYNVSVWRLVLFALPIAILSVILGAMQFYLFGRRFRRGAVVIEPVEVKQ
jgi:uncharacterized membrane protein